MNEVRTKVVLTPAQKKLLVAMYEQGSSRFHHVSELGFRQPVLEGLVKKGYAMFSTSWRGDAMWKGKLTTVGRREARELLKG